MRPGRLDQLIYIPCLTTSLAFRFCAQCFADLSQDVDLQYLAAQTEKFTGADLTKYVSVLQSWLCVKILCSLWNGIVFARKLKGVVMDTDGRRGHGTGDPPPLRGGRTYARRSVSDRDLAQYSSFASTPAVRTLTSGGFSFHLLLPGAPTRCCNRVRLLTLPTSNLYSDNSSEYFTARGK